MFANTFVDGYDWRADNVELEKQKPEVGSGQVATGPVASRMPGDQQPTITQQPTTAQPTTAQPTEQDNPFQGQEDYIKTLYGQIGERPKPEYDEGREKRLQTMAGASGVAKALSVLGDVFGGTQGAMVKPNQIQPDQYVDRILQDRKDYENKLDQYEQQQYLDAIRKASGLASARGADEATKESARRWDITQEQQAERDKESSRRWDITQEQQAERDKESSRRWDITQEQQAARDAESKRRFEKEFDYKVEQNAWKQLQAEQKANGKLFDLITPDGKTKIPVQETGELQAIYSAIINDKDPKLRADAIDKLNIMRSKLEGMNSNDLKNFVQEFWHRSPAAREVIEGLRGAGTATPPPPSVSLNMPWLGDRAPSTTVDGAPMARLPETPAGEPAAQKEVMAEEQTPQQLTEAKLTELKNAYPDVKDWRINDTGKIIGGGNIWDVTNPGDLKAMNEFISEGKPTTEIDRAAFNQAVKAKDAKAIRTILSGSYSDEDINSFLKSRGIEEAAEETTTEESSTITGDYSPAVRSLFDVKILLPNKANEIVAAMADEAVANGQIQREDVQQFMNDNIGQVKADIAAERQRRKDEGSKSEGGNAYKAAAESMGIEVPK